MPAPARSHNAASRNRRSVGTAVRLDGAGTSLLLPATQLVTKAWSAVVGGCRRCGVLPCSAWGPGRGSPPSVVSVPSQVLRVPRGGAKVVRQGCTDQWRTFSQVVTPGGNHQQRTSSLACRESSLGHLRVKTPAPSRCRGRPIHAGRCWPELHGKPSAGLACHLLVCMSSLAPKSFTGKELCALQALCSPIHRALYQNFQAYNTQTLLIHPEAFKTKTLPTTCCSQLIAQQPPSARHVAIQF